MLDGHFFRLPGAGAGDHLEIGIIFLYYRQPRGELLPGVPFRRPLWDGVRSVRGRTGTPSRKRQGFHPTKDHHVPGERILPVPEKLLFPQHENLAGMWRTTTRKWERIFWRRFRHGSRVSPMGDPAGMCGTDLHVYFKVNLGIVAPDGDSIPQRTHRHHRPYARRRPFAAARQFGRLGLDSSPARWPTRRAEANLAHVVART